jgi:hypothetical protein
MSIEHNILINHLISKKRTRSYKDLTSKQIKRLKLKALDTRAKTICQSEDYKKYMDWLFNLQKRANMSDIAFAKALGLKTTRMLFYWKAKSGYLPSLKVRDRALRLERSLENEVNVTKNKVRINVCK